MIVGRVLLIFNLATIKLLIISYLILLNFSNCMILQVSYFGYRSNCSLLANKMNNLYINSGCWIGILNTPFQKAYVRKLANEAESLAVLTISIYAKIVNKDDRECQICTVPLLTSATEATNNTIFHTIFL